jgi:hypothetical protein
VSSALHLRTETDPFSEKLCFLVVTNPEMDIADNPNNSELLTDLERHVDAFNFIKLLLWTV